MDTRLDANEIIAAGPRRMSCRDLPPQGLAVDTGQAARAPAARERGPLSSRDSRLSATCGCTTRSMARGSDPVPPWRRWVADGSWPSGYATELARDFRVILADSRGHGRTADAAGPITYGRLTFDVVRLLDHLGIDRVHVVGHSVGAIVGLHLLVDFPDRVRTVTLLAGPYHVDNYRPESREDMKRELTRSSAARIRRAGARHDPCRS